ncbi:hypothetical protein ACFFX0_09260 [Citricoccus parietis]|uniref:Uncharacterized protein n=1 Tax=Citricoccus parietis TaxID=592307 RepID=A0ABV5FXE8_9MICC
MLRYRDPRGWALRCPPHRVLPRCGTPGIHAPRRRHQQPSQHPLMRSRQPRPAWRRGGCECHFRLIRSVESTAHHKIGRRQHWSDWRCPRPGRSRPSRRSRCPLSPCPRPGQ